MINSNKIVQLNWIREPLGELLNKLGERLRRLEKWSDEQSWRADEATAVWDESALLLRQIQSTLHLARVRGAAIFSAEILALGEYLYHQQNGPVTSKQLQWLQEAQLTLQDYLDYVSLNRVDQTLVLTRHINRLRQARKAELMHEGQLFFPQLEREPLPAEDSQQPVSGKLSSLRGRWQRALRDWLLQYQPKLGRSGDQAAAALYRMTLSLALSQQLSEALCQTCTLTAEVIQAARLGCSNSDVDLGRLLARLDVLLSRHEQLSSNAPADADPDSSADTTTQAHELSRAMLYFLASCQPVNDRVQSVRDHYQLETFIDQQSLDAARASLRGKNRALSEAVAGAIHSELDELKNLVERLQLSLQSDPATASDEHVRNDELAQTLHASIMRMGGSLRVIGFTDIADRLQQQAPDLLDDGAATQSALNQLASTLLDFESRLLANNGGMDSRANSGQANHPTAYHASDSIHESGLAEVINQSVKQLDHVQQQLDGLLREAAAGNSKTGLSEEPLRQLQRISGVLVMINETQLAQALQRGVVLLRSLDWRSSAILSDASLQHFAAMLAALERYLISIRDRMIDASMRIAALASSEQLPQLDQATDDARPGSTDDLGFLTTSAHDTTEPETKADTAIQPTSPPASAVIEPEPDQAAVSSAAHAVLPEIGEHAWTADPELQAIFLQELDELMPELDRNVSEFIAAPAADATLLHVRRCFHTFKGSARMVGASCTGAYAYAVEMLLNAVRDVQLPADNIAPLLPDLMQHMHKLQQALHDGYDLCNETSHALIRQCLAMAGQPVAAADDLSDSSSTAAAEEPFTVADETQQPTPGNDEDQQFTSIINEELADHVQTVDEFLLRCQQQDHGELADAELIRSVHTIAGTLALQAADDDGDSRNKLVHDIESLLLTMRDQDLPVTSREQSILASLSAQVHASIEQSDPGNDQSAAGWEQLQSLLRQTLHELETGPAEQTQNADDETDAYLGDMADSDMAGTELEQAPPELGAAAAEDELMDVPDDPFDFDLGATSAAEAENEYLSDAKTGAEDEIENEDETEAKIEHEGAADIAASRPEISADYANLDDSILEIFLDEASTGIDNMDHAVRRWIDHDDLSAAADLRRSLHTMKGAANMAGLTPIGQLSHALETYLESQPLENMQPSELQAVESSIDQLHEMLGAVATRAVIPIADLTAFNALTLPPMELESDTDEYRAQLNADAIDGTADSTGDGIGIATTPDDSGASQTDSKAEPVIAKGRTSLRVDAALIDRLSNIAGEVGIFRAHLEQETDKLRGGINEMGQTIERLRDQLRKLELETEAQILSRHQYEKETTSDFDPLELDRYSTIQQLSRALAESANDMVNLQETIDNTSQHAESLLAQQARSNAELQDGLLQTRMVPFANIAPRLRQVVRRSAAELDKPAELTLDIQAGGELDRSALERITGPLEHLLRNALAHGIEDAQTRRDAGKPEAGQINIDVFREAAELIIRVQDDGRGLDLQTILDRAREKGLVDPDIELEDRDIAQLIFTPGFSTATEVSELAGRGVGLDVVQTTVRQIGGTLQWHSEPGSGMQFLIRIPLSLAVMQALLVECDERLYAIPVVNVLGVTKIPKEEYLSHLEQGFLPYANESNPIFDLESLLGMKPLPISENLVTILVVESAGQRAAIRVTTFSSHQELVVKPLGPQLTSIPGILAGSISREGEIILILEPGALVSARLGSGQQPQIDSESSEQAQRKQPLVLIVDDSITMRKITSRVLEQHDIEVRTARDGLEAIDQMREELPDLLLLDIEMPRMDGFELTTYMRASDSKMRDIPIIIVSSRSGDKHQQRARDLGATDFIGKPYGEKDLMLKVNQLLAETLDRIAGDQA